jgi:hypothetical protein
MIEVKGVEAVIPARVNRRKPALHDQTKYKWRKKSVRVRNVLSLPNV